MKRLLSGSMVASAVSIAFGFSVAAAFAQSPPILQTNVTVPTVADIGIHGVRARITPGTTSGAVALPNGLTYGRVITQPAIVDWSTAPPRDMYSTLQRMQGTLTGPQVISQASVITPITTIIRQPAVLCPAMPSCSPCWGGVY